MIHIGKPALLYESTNPDWVPTKEMGYNSSEAPDQQRYVRLENRKRRRLSNTQNEVEEQESGVGCQVTVFVAECGTQKGKKQLEKLDIDWSRELSTVRIHVERVIGVLKQKYTILQSILPITLIPDYKDSKSTIDKIVQVCCVCVNL